MLRMSCSGKWSDAFVKADRADGTPHGPQPRCARGALPRVALAARQEDGSASTDPRNCGPCAGIGDTRRQRDKIKIARVRGACIEMDQSGVMRDQ